MCIGEYVRIQLRAYVCVMNVCVCMCVFECMYACRDMCVYVFVNYCVYVCLDNCMLEHAVRACVCVHMCRQMFEYVCG